MFFLLLLLLLLLAMYQHYLCARTCSLHLLSKRSICLRLSFPSLPKSFFQSFHSLRLYEMCDRTTIKEININTMCIMFIANINFQCKPKYIHTLRERERMCVRVCIHWVEKMQISEQFLSTLIACCLSFYPWLTNNNSKKSTSSHEAWGASNRGTYF